MTARRRQPRRIRIIMTPPVDEQLPPSTWLTRRTRSVGLRRPSSSLSACSGGTRVGGVLHDMNIVQLASEDESPADSGAQAPAQIETRSGEGDGAEGLDEGGSGLATGAGDPVERVGMNMRQMAKTSELTTGSSPWSLHSEGLNWQTVPVVEASILHELHKTQLAKTKLLDFETDDDVDAQPSSTLHAHDTREKSPIPEFHFQLPETEDFKLPEVATSEDSAPIQLQSEQAAAAPGEYSSNQRVRFKGVRELANLQAVKKRGRPPGRRSDSPAAGPSLKQVIGKPDYKTLGKFLLGQDCNITDMDDSDARPPHPYDIGKVHQVNICPVCEQYTVTERDRPAESDPDREALRARFECSLCGEWFDMGITLFDPRGTPGVTLYQGDDRFRPPVPPRSTYPCTRCWMNTDTSFKCMVLYLREESRVQCEPECPAGRVNASLQQPEKKSQELDQKKYTLRSRSVSDAVPVRK